MSGGLLGFPTYPMYSPSGGAAQQLASTAQMEALAGMAQQRGPYTIAELQGMQNAWAPSLTPGGFQQPEPIDFAAPGDWAHRRVYIMWLATLTALAVIRWAAIGLWPL